MQALPCQDRMATDTMDRLFKTAWFGSDAIQACLIRSAERLSQ
jgi:hypothetical protein